MDYPLDLAGVTGTSADDVWFVGTRGWTPGQCTVVVRKTPAGYERIIDGIPRSDYYNCDPKKMVIRWLADPCEEGSSRCRKAACSDSDTAIPRATAS